MGLPHFKSLCGTSLESGSKAIGFILLALRFLWILLLIIQYFQVVDDLKAQEVNFSPNKTSRAFAKDAKMMIAEFKRALLVQTVVAISVLLILALFDVLMLIGVYKRSRSFIFPWFIVQIIAICLAIYQVIRMFNVPINIIFIVCTIYFSLVVNSHYKNLKTEPTSSNSIS